MKQCPNCNSRCDDTKIYCSNCGSLLKTVPAPDYSSTSRSEQASSSVKQKSKVLPLLLAFSIAANIILGIVAISWYQDAIRYKGYYDDYWDISGEYYFYNSYARIVPDDGSGKYHRYDCSKLDDDDSFFIYNVGTAKNKASPCKYCCSDD